MTFEEWLWEYHALRLLDLNEEETVAYFETYEMWKGGGK